jgi:hypothetical protein
MAMEFIDRLLDLHRFFMRAFQDYPDEYDNPFNYIEDFYSNKIAGGDLHFHEALERIEGIKSSLTFTEIAHVKLHIASRTGYLRLYPEELVSVPVWLFQLPQ